MTESLSITREIAEKLSIVRKKQLLVDLQSQSGLFFTVAILLFGSATFSELLFHFPSSVRTALVLLFFTIVLLSLAWFLIRPALRTFGVLSSWDDYALARRIGDFFPHVRDRLLNLLQLQLEARHGTRYSLELIDASFQDFTATIQSVDFSQSVNVAPARQSLRNVAASLIAVLVPFIFFPAGFSDSVYRLAHYDKEFVPPARYAFQVLPGNKEVIKGDRVSVSVTVNETGGTAYDHVGGTGLQLINSVLSGGSKTNWTSRWQRFVRTLRAFSGVRSRMSA